MNYKIEMKTTRDLNSEEEFQNWIDNQKQIWFQAGFNKVSIDNLEDRLRNHGFVKFSGPGVVTKISMEVINTEKEKN